MKQLSLFLLCACLISFSSQAQLKDALTKASSAGAPNAGNLLSQFAGALKPTSFLPSWGSGGKTDWLSAAGKVSNAVSMAKSVSSLTSFIKPDMFKSGFNVGSITQAASAAKTYSDASNVLKSLEGGLKPEAFLSSWASKRSGWLSALSMLK
ncbi:MAG: hypothetical protein JST68_07050 [Bacteroidetes bacterium]|nr:hypothetical protein [Bacteroidota bacterium]